jgi:hypothetical protein
LGFDEGLPVQSGGPAHFHFNAKNRSRPCTRQPLTKYFNVLLKNCFLNEILPKSIREFARRNISTLRRD